LRAADWGAETLKSPGLAMAIPGSPEAWAELVFGSVVSMFPLAMIEDFSVETASESLTLTTAASSEVMTDAIKSGSDKLPLVGLLVRGHHVHLALIRLLAAIYGLDLEVLERQPGWTFVFRW
jgi:hypothetical protein